MTCRWRGRLRLLRLSRSQLYYEPRPVPAAELAIMRRIDALHLDYPFAGSRMLRLADLPAELHPFYRFATFEEAQADFLGSIWRSRSPEDEGRYKLAR